MNESFEQFPQAVGETEQALESREHVEALIEAALLEGVKADEGNNGVIFEIQAEHLSEEVKQYLFPDGVKEGMLAGKVLKIYHEGKGTREASFQSQAFEANGGNVDSEAAKIPEISTYREMEIQSPELLKKLKAAGVRHPEKIAIILMDYIPGDDLARHIYKQVISRWPNEEERISIEHLSHLTFMELHQQICRLLNYSVPTSQQKAEGNDILIYRENERTLRGFLRRNEIIFDPEIFARLERTLIKLHQAGIFHNDVHERNIKLIFDDAGALVDVYLLDFGAASEAEDGDRRFNDFELIRKYQPLTVSRTEEKNRELDDLQDNIFAIKNHFSKSKEKKKEWKGYMQDMETALQAGKLGNALQVALSAFSLSGNNYELVGAILFQYHKEYREGVEWILGEMPKKVKMRPQFWIDLRRLFK